MTIMNKDKEWKALRVLLHKEDWEACQRQAQKEHLPLATWVRQKTLGAIELDVKHVNKLDFNGRGLGTE